MEGAYSHNKRIAKNTLMLYFRQILVLLVSLYTVRVVLDVLGVEDFGIYSVVGGIVALFSFISGAMASATQRFFSYSLGISDQNKLKKTFIVNLIIYISISLIALLLLETIGLWFVKNHLKIPPNKFHIVIIVYHFSVLSFISSILASPFRAIIIAHEDMKYYAYISIFESIFKLGIVIILQFSPGDKLKLYSILVFFVSFLTSTIYISLCFKKYSECSLNIKYWDKKLFQEILSFTSWTLFGYATSVARNQAITVLLNQIFNPTIVAARAIATNVTTKINLFSNEFNVGLYPPIIKTYAAKDKSQMFLLIFNGSKISFFLIWIFALPLILEMEFILNIWLKNPPPQAVLFTRLALIEVLINSFSLPIATAARAPGKMKIYELVLGIIQILIFLTAFLVLRIGAQAFSVYIIAIVANFIMLVVRLFIVKHLIDLNIYQFLIKVLLPVFGVITLSTISSFSIHLFAFEGVLLKGFSIIIYTSLTLISIYLIGLDKYWKLKIKNIIYSRIKKVI